MRLKYVTIEGEFGLTVPLIFPEHAEHAHTVRGKKVIGAGFVSIDWEDKRVIPYGESVSLGVKPHADDQYHLEKMLFGQHTSSIPVDQRKSRSI